MGAVDPQTPPFRHGSLGVVALLRRGSWGDVLGGAPLPIATSASSRPKAAETAPQRDPGGGCRLNPAR